MKYPVHCQTPDHGTELHEWNRKCLDANPEFCRHRPRKDDTLAGYSGCMFCIETGDCSHARVGCPGGYCPDHGATWEVWKEQAAFARSEREAAA